MTDTKDQLAATSGRAAAFGRKRQHFYNLPLLVGSTMSSWTDKAKEGLRTALQKALDIEKLQTRKCCVRSPGPFTRTFCRKCRSSCHVISVSAFTRNAKVSTRTRNQ